MALREYQRKRNFNLTTEPRGGKTKAQRKPIFVVQLHHARRRHYDFRLQIGDVLKSWAVPKGPSFDPEVKRLAVEVEDHPLAYATFEGDIPAGQYGAGHVEIFDHGTWSPILDPNLDETDGQAGVDRSIARQLHKGHLQFTLDGGKLHGAWHLVRSHREERQPQWMLFKAHDAFVSTTEADDWTTDTVDKKNRQPTRTPAAKAARRTSKKSAATRAPANWTQRALTLANATRARLKAGPFAPELAHSVSSAPQGDQWLHETKWDGYRLLATIVEGNVQLWSRNALEWTDRVPDVRHALQALGLNAAQLDGELIAVSDGTSSFNELQAVLAGERHTPLIYAVFDLMHLDGVALHDCSLLDRKALLQEIVQRSSSPHLLLSAHHIGDGPQVFALAARQGLEGIVSKRTASRYRAGRGNDWLKVKSVLTDEFAIVGYTQPRGARRGIGALLLARPEPGQTWRFVGRMGSGLSDAQLRQLGGELPKLRLDAPPVSDASLLGRDVGKPTWIKPAYVVEVYYRGFGKEGLLRQASLKALREDKTAKDLRTAPDTPALDEATPMHIVASKTSARTAKTPSAGRGRSRARQSAPRPLDYVTHPERVVYPRDGLTKLQVAQYYEAIMPWLLPQIANRPLSLLRCPSNVKTCFFQKHHGDQFGAHVHAVRIRNSEGGMENYIYVSDADGVRDVVQMNVLEFHPWGSTTEAVEHADVITFDLDPGPKVSWERVIAAAELLRDVLADIGLQSFVKTSGGKGLHVVVPLRPAQPWALVKQWCKQIAAAVTQARPKEFIDVATKAKRPGKIFIDYLRNGRGATSVAAYSLRARDGAPLAMPLAWRELRHTRSGGDYTLLNAPAQLRKRKQDPWRKMPTVKQAIKT